MCALHTAVYYRMYNCKFSSQALRGFVFFSIVSKISKKYMSGLKKKFQEMLTLSRGIDDYILVMFQILEGLWSFDLLEVKGQNQRPRGFEHKAAYCIATACMYTVLQSYRWGKGCYDIGLLSVLFQLLLVTLVAMIKMDKKVWFPFLIKHLGITC